MQKVVFALFTVLYSGISFGFGSGSATCSVVANFSNITAMSNRVRNFNNGSYTLTSNTPFYGSSEHVEITIEGPTFTGILVEVVDDDGNKVGTFSPDAQVRSCDGAAMAVTHTNTHGNVNSRTVFWIPPAEPVGTVHVLAYVLSGVRGNQSSQEFYRFVREDNSALSIGSEQIFNNGFE